MAYTVVLGALLAAPVSAHGQLLGPDGVKIGDAVQVGPGGAKVGPVQVPVPTVEPVRQVVEPVRQVVEPVRQVVEPVRQVVEPVRQVTEPVRQVVEPVRRVTEPVRQIAEPGPSSGSPATSGDPSPARGGSPASTGDPPAGGGSGGSPTGTAPQTEDATNGSRPSGDAEGLSAPRGSPARIRAERRIRRAVARLSGCLDELPAGQRRVLVLRGGVGTPARSRRGVARRLDVPVARVRRLERSGLRRARGLARAGACGEAGSGTVVAGSGAVLASAQTSGGAPAPAGSRAAKRTQAGGAGAAAPETGDIRGESAERGLSLPQALAEPPFGIPLGIALALVALATIAGFYTPALRSRLRRR